MTRRPSLRPRRGAVIVYASVLAVAMMAMLAFSIDYGYMYTVQSQLDRAVDSAALAGASELFNGEDVAEEKVVEYLVRNPVGQSNTVVAEDQITTMIAEWKEKHSQDLTLTFGNWDPDTRQLTPATSTRPASAIKVEMTYPNNPLFFGRVFGQDRFQVRSSAIATFQPRDIVVVIDLSASMNDDSELKSINKLGQAAIEENLLQIYEELGSPTYGNLTFEPQYVATSDVQDVLVALGLDSVPYPYAQGSWAEYVQWVQSDYYNWKAGYYKRYGYLNLINYWLYYRPLHSQTEDLWKVSAQPITSVKDAVDVFVDYVELYDTKDRLALAVYNSSGGVGQLEVPLTTNFAAVRSSTRAKQAGHYHGWTNIGGGLQTAREHLQAEARTGAFKMIVLLTDGVTNWTASGYNPSAAREQVFTEADRCAELGIPVFTISLGAGADTALMQDVADTTEAYHFNIPGGSSVETYRAQLMDAFRQIASHRPLKLVANNYSE